MCRPSAAIIVACLASFRQLFIKSEQADLKRQKESLQLGSGSLRSCFWPLKSVTKSENRSLSSREIDIERVFTSSQNSTSCKIPMDSIHVRKDVNISMDDEGHDIQEAKFHHHNNWSLPAPGVSYNLQIK